jgi:hypothetical protein
MNERTETPEQPRPDARAPWERPAVSCLGTIALVVRGGSAQGKIFGALDGDTGMFQCSPETCPPKT